ncbi:tetratricopeptide repeat protein [Actinacidiphila epipremni]|uniref:Tetratricopeptide repeat protein n=1 Tax=Actinacidiphila epipremni TaxID=2053013 RepID=A0ABX0ZL55_9ACTN|nr:tetratricopeptide repeat protein [Actinacidiphila epipremni]NJP43466.1 tetratricopeptide repeat protein [Actinacidiphila epipremni]
MAGRGRTRRGGLGAGRDVRISAAGGGLAVGSAGHVTVQAAARQRAELPHQVGVVPSRAASFQARAEAERLRAALAGGGTAVLCQVLTGTGGVGKTQLAADFAHRAWDEGALDVLVWVTAASRSAIVAAYAQAGAELCGADPSDPERAAGAFLAWLRAKRHRWLVVLDDVADPDDLKALWPPGSSHGRTLLTTRRRDAALTGTGRRRIDVGVFSAQEATGYLAATLAAHDRTEPEAELAALADDLGRLPLALSQAAAYLADQGLTVAGYRALLADRTRKLAHAMPAEGSLPDDQRNPVAATWSLSVDLADRSEPRGLARPLLDLASMLDPNGIPEAVLTSPPARKLVGAMGRPWRFVRGRSRMSEAEVHETLRVLHRLSLIEHSPDAPHRAVRVHALIQRTTRDALPRVQRLGTAVTVATALLAAWPEIERDTELAQALRSNATALAANTARTGDLFHLYVHPVLFRLAMSLGESGQLAGALDSFQDLVDTATRRLGPDHRDTFAARGNLIDWQGKAGDPAGAVLAHLALLRDEVRVLGPKHPHTFVTRHNLAHWRGMAGDPATAAEALAGLLEDRLRVLGPDHPDTLTTRANVARWRGEAGDLAGAAEAFTALAKDQLRVLGPDHPETFTTRHNLAVCRGRAGEAREAAEVLAHVVDDRRRVLGPDHPETLTARHNLAHWRGEAGDAAGAVKALGELLEDRLRVLGPDHPDTGDTRDYLAYWRQPPSRRRTSPPPT